MEKGTFRNVHSRSIHSTEGSEEVSCLVLGFQFTSALPFQFLGKHLGKKSLVRTSCVGVQRLRMRYFEMLLSLHKSHASYTPALAN